MKASGTLKRRPPRPPSYFYFVPPNLPLKRSAMSRASSMCCFWSAPAPGTTLLRALAEVQHVPAGIACLTH